MKEIKIILFFVITLIFTANVVLAATYYIDYSMGDDTNNGTSTSTPFQHCPGDPRATDNADIVPSAGDIIVFKGGVTYAFDPNSTDYIYPGGSGSSGNVITLTSGHIHSSEWPDISTRAIIDGTNVNFDYNTDYTGVITLKNLSYITISGLQIQYAPFIAYTGLIGFKGDTGGNITIDNCILFSDISPANASTTVWTGIAFQGAWNATTAQNFTISNCEIYDTGCHGVFLRAGVNGVLVENNIIHDCGPNPSPYQGDGFFLDIGGTVGPTNITIRGNEFYDFEEKGCGLIGGLADTILVENNYCYENDVTDNGFGFTVHDGSNITYQNNLIVEKTAGNWGGLFRIALGANASNIKYYNNTLIGNNAGFAFYLYKAEYTLTNVTIKNNIVDMNAVGTPQDYIRVPTTIDGVFSSDHNIFYGGDASPFYYDSNALTFTEWKSVTSQDANSLETDPSLNANYYPDSLSDPTISFGEDLTSEGVTADKDGVSRPQGAGFEVGAYEFIQESIQGVTFSGVSIQ